MKSKPASHRKCQLVGVRCIALFGLFLFAAWTPLVSLKNALSRSRRRRNNFDDVVKRGPVNTPFDVVDHAKMETLRFQVVPHVEAVDCVSDSWEEVSGKGNVSERRTGFRCLEFDDYGRHIFYRVAVLDKRKEGNWIECPKRFVSYAAAKGITAFLGWKHVRIWKELIVLPNVPDEVSLPASGTQACSAGDVPEVPQAQGLAPSARSAHCVDLQQECVLVIH